MADKIDWLTKYQEYTSTQESPAMFHLWVGLSMLASSLGRKCYFNKGYYNLYPNLYVVLVGASATVRKSTAVNLGYHLFRLAVPEACVLAQKITPEALIQVLGKRGEETGNSDVVMVSTELSVFLGSNNREDSLIQLLTKLYDCEDEMDYHTVGRGKESCSNVCFNLIGATTPEWMKTSMPASAIGGGFTSRIVFIYQYKPERKVPFPHLTKEQEILKAELVTELHDISMLKGEFILTKDARDWYEQWYCDIFKPDMNDPSLDGYYGRKHDSVLKLSMLFCVNRSGKQLVDEIDLRMALTSLNENERYLPNVMRNIQSNMIGEERNKVLRAVNRKGKLPYAKLLRSLSYCMNAQRLNEILMGLVAEGVVKETIVDGKRIFKGGE